MEKREEKLKESESEEGWGSWGESEYKEEIKVDKKESTTFE